MNCPHGMPTPASCVACMEDGPVVPRHNPPRPTDIFEGALWVRARFEGRCALRYQHEIHVDDSIGYVDGVGWCCSECCR